MVLTRKMKQLFTSDNGTINPMDSLCDEVSDLATNIYMQLDSLECGIEAIAGVIPSLISILCRLNDKCIETKSLQQNIVALEEEKECLLMKLKRQQSKFDEFQEDALLAEKEWQNDRQTLSKQVLSLKGNTVNSVSSRVKVQDCKVFNSVSVQTDPELLIISNTNEKDQKLPVEVNHSRKNQLVDRTLKKPSKRNFNGRENGYTLHKNWKSCNKPRIEIFSDSQGRGIASDLKSHFGNSSLVLGMVLPGASINRVVSSALERKNLNSLSCNDYTIIITGTKDFTDNKFCIQAICNPLRELIGELTNTKVIIGTIPYRYDLHKESKENIFIETVNREIRSLVAIYKNATLLELHTICRCFYTTHGLYINNTGKRKISEMIMEIIKSNHEDCYKILREGTNLNKMTAV